eukprot:417840-Rhodomonas_salina.1
MPDYQVNRNKKKNKQTKAAYANNPEVKELARKTAREHYQKRKLAYELLKATKPDLVKSLSSAKPTNPTNPDLVKPLTPLTPV